MKNPVFRFKKGWVHQENSPLKISSDAVLFGAWVNEKVKKTFQSCLDVGAGTGVLTWMLAWETDAHFTLLDINPLCENDWRITKMQSHLFHRIQPIICDFADFSPMKDQEFDLIISNPPWFIPIDAEKSKNAQYGNMKAAQAKQFGHLPPHVFWDGLIRCASHQTQIALLISADTWPLFQEEGLKRNFYIQHQLQISSRSGKPPHAIASLWSHNPCESLIEELGVFQSPGIYNKRYQELTGTWYL